MKAHPFRLVRIIDHGYSLNTVARATGISARRIARIEKWECSPDVDELCRLAVIFGFEDLSEALMPFLKPLPETEEEMKFERTKGGV